MNILDSLKGAQGQDQPVKGERREERQQQEPAGEAPFRPQLMKKYREALHPDTPDDQSQATLQVLFNLPLLPPVARAQFLAGNLPIADLVTRLRGFQNPQLKQRLAPLVQNLSFFQAGGGQQQQQPKSEQPVEAPPAPEESSEMPLPGSESSSRQKAPSAAAPAQG